MSCEEFIKAFQYLKQEKNSNSDKKFIGEAKIFFINNIGYNNEYYFWEQSENVKFYRSYDSVTDRIETGGYYGPRKTAKRKLEKRIYVQGLSEHCFQ